MTKENWKEIHHSFDFDCSKENWEINGFNYQETKKWIDLGLHPKEIGLAFCLKQNGYQATQLSVNDLEKLRNEYYNAQNWIDLNYPKQKRSEIKELIIFSYIFGYKGKLKGSLKLEEFTNLEKFNCDGNELTNLDVSQCVKLEAFNCVANQLTSLDLSKNKNLTYLDCSNNKIKKLNLKNNIDLTLLDCPRNQLASLDLNKNKNLTVLDCSDNQLTSLKVNNCSKLTSINFFNNQLTNLDISNCSSLNNLECYNNSFSPSAVTNLEISAIDNCPQLERIRWTCNAQEWLNWYYSSGARDNITELDITYNRLEGSLKLENFVNLKKFSCSEFLLGGGITQLEIVNCPNLEEVNCTENQITNLTIKNCPKLARLYCSDNYLTEFDFDSLRTEKLTSLSIRNNNLSMLNLACFSHLVNLEWLSIGSNNPDQVKKGIYNHFFGSLEPLKNLTKLEGLDICGTDINSGLEYLPDSLWSFRCDSVDGHTRAVALEEILKAYKTKRRWTDYDEYRASTSDYSPDEHQYIDNLRAYKQWIKLNFTEKEVKEWINAGVNLEDYEFVVWLKDIKNYTLQWILDYKEDYQILSKRFKKYGLCPECNQPNTGEKWCKDCNSKRLQESVRPSKNLQIDKFIQKYQLQATEANKFIEWIPYEQFKDVEYLAEGGFGKVYKAKWTEGNISHWDIENGQWQRERDYYYEKEEEVEIIEKEEEDEYYSNYEERNKDRQNRKYKNHCEVVLKSLTDSSESIDFLQETEKHKIIDDWFNNIVPCYGLSQDPKTGNYLMVMKYLPEGNLRKYLDHKNKELTLKDKLSHLAKIAQGLKDIHAKDLVHRDFHSGNILKGIEKASCLITDLGLCRPVGEVGKKDQIFGVMPYVAPEVLRSQPYTKASDVYSFGIIAYEVLSGLPPYYEVEHSIQLALAICDEKQPLRPQFQIKIPQLLEDLTKNCWNANPNQRPTANELEKTLRKWQEEINSYKDSEFKKQLQGAEEYNQTLPNSIKYSDYKNKMHKGAVYHSRLLPTKEITQLLSQSQSGQIYEQVIIKQIYLKETSDLESCAIPNVVGNQLQNLSLDNWTNIHPSFNQDQIQAWTNLNFTYTQTQDWINIGLTPQDYNLANFLKNQKNLTPEQTLNNYNLENLKTEFNQFQQNQEQQTFQVQTINRPNN